MKIRYKRPDKKNALSILEAAKRDMTFTLSMQLTEQSGPTIVRNSLSLIVRFSSLTARTSPYLFVKFSNRTFGIMPYTCDYSIRFI